MSELVLKRVRIIFQDPAKCPFCERTVERKFLEKHIAERHRTPVAEGSE